MAPLNPAVFALAVVVFIIVFCFWNRFDSFEREVDRAILPAETVYWWDSAPWVVNFPVKFLTFQKNDSKQLSELTLKPTILPSNLPGDLIDGRSSPSHMDKFVNFVGQVLPGVTSHTDGESIDAIEHFFWGMENGLAIELGALDGSPATHSQTYEHESILGWSRILIEANPEHRNNMKNRSPGAIGLISAICNSQRTIHYAVGQGNPYTGGILEFMSLDYMKTWHPDLYNACSPKGDASTLNFNKYGKDRLLPVDCLPLHYIFHKLQVRHVNLFILDVEGAELDVLKSIDFKSIVFDVLSVETEDRAIGYNNSVIAYLENFGYRATLSSSMIGKWGRVTGRNTWFVHKSFTPSRRPGLNHNCYNGVNHAYGRSRDKDGKYVPC